MRPLPSLRAPALLLIAGAAALSPACFTLTTNLEGLTTGGKGGGTASGTSSRGGAGGTAGGTSSTGGSGGTGIGPCCLQQVCGDAGRCVAVEIDAVSSPKSLVIDDQFIYWAGAGALDGTIKRLPKSPAPGETPVTLESAEPHANNLAVRDGYAYWTTWAPVDGGGTATTTTVWRRSLQAGSGAPDAIWTSPGSPTSLAVDGSHVYWSTYEDNNDSTVYKAPSDGTGSITKLAASNAYSLASVTLDEKHLDDKYVYWVRGDNSNGGIQRIDKNKPLTAGDVITGQPSPRFVRVEDGVLYWTNGSGGATGNNTVNKAPAGGGTTMVLAKNQKSPNAIAVHDGRVAWTTLASGAADGEVLYRSPEGTPVLLAEGQTYPETVAVDEHAVYWANSSNGEVRKIGVCACTPSP